MTQSIDLLKERYLTHIKDDPEIFVGIELEFPIVNRSGRATDIEVAKKLLKTLAQAPDFEVERWDSDGNPIQLKAVANADRILFEVSYNTLEFAFDKARVIQEVEGRFKAYLERIQAILRKDNHEIQGKGLHPHWQENDNSPVKYPRYQMLMQYLALGEKLGLKNLHAYPQYGAFICGSQVQLDVSRSNYLRVINAFNQVEAAKAYLFANSSFSCSDWSSRISRDIFWEDSMHGILEENAGVNAKSFDSEDDFFAYLDKSAIFTADREGKSYYFYPIAARDYLAQQEIRAYDLEGQERILHPQAADFKNHRSYQYQDLTTRGTVEFRSTCTQPLEATFAPAAFHLGLLENLDALETYLKTANFFKKYGRDYKKLRRAFSRIELSQDEETDVRQFAHDLLQVARQGLEKRGKGEEVYLDKLG